MSDLINNPAHYTQQPIECIEITEHLNFNLGNAVKYLWRYEDKAKPLEDLKKAHYYLKRQFYKEANFLLIDWVLEQNLLEKIAKCNFNRHQFNIISSVIEFAKYGNYMELLMAIDELEDLIND